MAKELSLEDRIWAHIVPEPNTGCWFWSGSHNNSGYARINLKTTKSKTGWKTCYLHRVTYEMYVGPIPNGKQIDHLCRQRGCCNPEHLEAVTPQQNVARGLASAVNAAHKTHCPYGHEYNDDNTYIDSKGWQHCNECRRQRDRKRDRSRDIERQRERRREAKIYGM